MGNQNLFGVLHLMSCLLQGCMGLNIVLKQKSRSSYYQVTCPRSEVLAPGNGIQGNHGLSERLRNITSIAAGKMTFDINLEQLTLETDCGPPITCLQRLFQCVDDGFVHRFCPGNDENITNQHCGYIQSCNVQGTASSPCSVSGCRLGIIGNPGTQVMVHVYQLSVTPEYLSPGLYSKAIEDAELMKMNEGDTRRSLSGVVLVLGKSDQLKRTRLLIGFQVFDGSSPVPALHCWRHGECWTLGENPPNDRGCTTITTPSAIVIPDNDITNSHKTTGPLSTGVIAGITMSALFMILLLILATCLAIKKIKGKKKKVTDMDVTSDLNSSKVYTLDNRNTHVNRHTSPDQTSPIPSGTFIDTHTQKEVPNDTDTGSGLYEEIGTVRCVHTKPDAPRNDPLRLHRNVDSLIIEENDLYVDLKDDVAKDFQSDNGDLIHDITIDHHVNLGHTFNTNQLECDKRKSFESKVGAEPKYNSELQVHEDRGQHTDNDDGYELLSRDSTKTKRESHGNSNSGYEEYSLPK